jgi:hypothetical protein
MPFDYSPILPKAPCFVLIKNLRYDNDDNQQKIATGKIISFSDELTPLLAQLNRPNLDFSSIKNLKRFLYTQGFFQELTLLEGSELRGAIDCKSIAEIDSRLSDGTSVDVILQQLFADGRLKECDIIYDFGGSSYHEKNRLKDFEVYRETFDIRFFGGDNKLVLFDFLKSFFDKHHLGHNIHELLKEIRFDFFEMMDAYNGNEKIYSYDLWHEFLHFLFDKDMIPVEILEDYLADTYF